MGIALGISRTVVRCPARTSPDRVRFKYNDRCLIPEDIVLRRWRDRSQEPTGVRAWTRFDGCRLPPATWLVVDECFRGGLSYQEAATDPILLASRVAEVRRTHPTWRAPTATKLSAMIACLGGRRVLDKILRRERNVQRPGLPDLFLYQVQADRMPFGARFVEVKRKNRRIHYREPVSDAQVTEIVFLRSLGLRAGVVYLLE